jgi:predicted MPP superfamily phosphohydrolase
MLTTAQLVRVLLLVCAVVAVYISTLHIFIQGRANLYLAGHTHGGQVALPFYVALVTLSRFDKKYESGLQRVGNTYLYVSRGIGMEGGPAP